MAGKYQCAGQPSTNYFQQKAYQLFPPNVQKEEADWEQGTMPGDLPLNSTICQPREGEILTAGPVVINGNAITMPGIE